MLKVKEELEGTSRFEVELAAKEKMTRVEIQKAEEVQDKDIDELLGWTNALNFDE